MEHTSPVRWIGTIPANELENAKSRVEKFNQRAARAGVQARYTVAYSEWNREEPAKLAGLPPVVTPYLTFVVLGETLSVDGWTFIATLSFDAEAGVITRPVPDAPAIDLSELRTLTTPQCDQCGTARYRKDIYVLLNRELGELKVVGRNCLAAFLGLDPSGSLNYIGWEPEDTLGELGGWAGEYRIPADALIAVTSAAVAEYGWTAKSAGTGEPTAYVVQRYFFPALSGKQAEEDKRNIERLNARLNAGEGVNAAVARAEAVLQWVRTTDDLRGEYGSNLRAVLNAETVSTRNVGIACSAVSSWAKSVERELERSRQRERAATSTWIGSEKERLRDLKLEVAAPPRFIEGDYGVTTLLTFVDETGNVFKWFASGTWELTAGEKVVLTGTVKKHEEYNGAKSTVLSRCKIA